jgi:hypothetical protein
MSKSKKHIKRKKKCAIYEKRYFKKNENMRRHRIRLHNNLYEILAFFLQQIDFGGNPHIVFDFILTCILYFEIRT